MDMRPGALEIDDILKDVAVNAPVTPDLDFSLDKKENNPDLFEEKSRKAWSHEVEPRCDFSPGKAKISFRNPEFGIISLWKRSLYGKTLSEIKSDDAMVDFFISGMVPFISKILGGFLNIGDWALVTAPKRRHKERNFASLVASGIAKGLNIKFYEDMALCSNKQRVNAVFSLGSVKPKEHNLIVFDDFVTSGSTMISMRNILLPLGHNLVFFTGINNKL